MKAFYAVSLLVFLASCGSETVTQVSQQPIENTPEVVQETIDDIDSAMQDIPVVEDSETSEVSENLSESESQDQTPEPDTVESLQVEQESTEKSPSSETQEIEDAPEQAMGTEPIELEPTLVELSTTYNNPKMEVVMNISMQVNQDDIIESISVTSPNYGGMPEFDSGIQAVVGMSVDEAAEYYVSGSSLTTPAFQAALKNG